MGIFGKSAQQKRIDSDATIIAEMRADLVKLREGVENLDATARTYRTKYSDEARKNANLTAENHRLTAELARLTTRGPGGRFVNPAKAAEPTKVTPLTAGENVAQDLRWDRQQAF